MRNLTVYYELKALILKCLLSHALENIIMHLYWYGFQQCEKIFQVNVHKNLKRKVKFTDIFRLIQGPL